MRPGFIVGGSQNNLKFTDMKIDRRKKVQYFRNMYSYKDVYVHKENGTYSVGINGTSHHYNGLPWFKAEIMVTSLVLQRL